MEQGKTSIPIGTHTLEFWTFDEMHDGLTQDGCTLFYLIRDGMTPLP